MKKLFVLFFLLRLCSFSIQGQTKSQTSSDSLAGHRIQRGKDGTLLAWYKPEVPGAAYSHVSKLAAEFIRSGTPIEFRTGLKMYLVTCCFEGPHMKGRQAFAEGRTGEDWMHNPACVYAGMVQSLALGYRAFSGDDSYLAVVKEMLDYQLANGTTAAGWVWAKVPYASADPFEKEYRGATKWENDGMRRDGLHGIEPDKVGELGYGYLKFYQVTGEEKYLQAALDCADALAANVRNVGGDLKHFTGVSVRQSPWPFRLNARTGVVHDEYSANVIEPIRLLDELLATRDRLQLDTARTNPYQKARDIAWNWLFSKNGPMKTYIWNGYFEDIQNDPDHSNRVNNIPLETARYLLAHPEVNPNRTADADALIRYVSTGFGTQNRDAIREQTWCYVPMASHTARYASVCALLYEQTGDKKYKEEAFRHFNWATYSTDPNGVVRVGPEWPGSWFSDGYSDYIKHFMEGLGAVPEWAPEDEDHLLRSSSVIQQITYQPHQLRYRTYHHQGQEVLRLTKKPKRITLNGQQLAQGLTKGNTWTWEPLAKGGVLRIRRRTGDLIQIDMPQVR